MIAVDTNVLVYAHREDAPWHSQAADLVRALAESSTPWAIPWPCVHEFLAVVTHPRIYKPASTLAQALTQVEAWLASPSIVLLSEAAGHLARLTEVLKAGRATGARVHDARVAALCLEHGVQELWSVDRDFSRFPTLKTKNPLRTATR